MEWRGGFGCMYVYMYVVPQVAEEDEGVREKAIEYVSTSLMSMRHILFIPLIPHPDNEKRLLTDVKKVSLIKSTCTFYFSVALLVVCLYWLTPYFPSILPSLPPSLSIPLATCTSLFLSPSSLPLLPPSLSLPPSFPLCPSPYVSPCLPASFPLSLLCSVM